MPNVTFFISGFILGAAIFLIFYWLRRKEAKAITNELLSQSESQKTRETELLLSRIKETFGKLSFDALRSNTEEFLKLAHETLSRETEKGEMELEGKKKLIDQTLNEMKEKLQYVQNIVTDLEKDREKKFGELSNQLKVTAEQTGKLQETTSQLRKALASTKTRGQWGERMAEDVLRLAGFVEGINYYKQKTLESAGTRPDYTFLLPQDLKVNMDVKFPLDNYLRYLEEEGETEKNRFKNQFLKDVKERIKEVTTREYINPQDKTVDYVIVFIPNEQVYAFINECDTTILDEALRSKVVLCSPITLYAVLAIIRQAVDSFNLGKTAAEILSLLGAFNKQWILFQNALEKMGKKIDEAQKEYYTLTTTRTNQLERPLRKIEELRKQKGISPDQALTNDAEILSDSTEELL